MVPGMWSLHISSVAALFSMAAGSCGVGLGGVGNSCDCSCFCALLINVLTGTKATPEQKHDLLKARAIGCKVTRIT